VRIFGERGLIVRPGLIVGPHDPTDRYTYWPHRVAKGGEVLVPGTPQQHVQFIDVRDLAAWMLRLVEGQVNGILHATGPEQALSMGAFLEACRHISASNTHFTWVDEQFLLDAGVAPWSDLPLWVPALDPSTHGFNDVDCSRAYTQGLRCRPVADTAYDTLEWARSRPEDHHWRAGIDAEREAELLQAWHTRQRRAL
jgi:2'-hydroxyisoflavone reductase